MLHCRPSAAEPAGTRPWTPGSGLAPGPQVARGVASTAGAGGICTAALAGVWPDPCPSASRSLSGPPTWALITGASSPSASSAINTARADPLFRCIGGTLDRSGALRAQCGDLPPLHLADERERPVERGLVVGARAHLGDGAVVGDLDRLDREARVDDVLQADLERLLALQVRPAQLVQELLGEDLGAQPPVVLLLGRGLERRDHGTHLLLGRDGLLRGGLTAAAGEREGDETGQSREGAHRRRVRCGRCR